MRDDRFKATSSNYLVQRPKKTVEAYHAFVQLGYPFKMSDWVILGRTWSQNRAFILWEYPMLPHNICIAKSTLALTSQRASSVIAVKGRLANLSYVSVKYFKEFSIAFKKNRTNTPERVKRII
ncbi:hypothetical protein M0802_016615 [Mischocyttarus mexicanus]|nr:hypothetical protein M0802_016615 [Mischocyttarus mexicanus]